jgi:transposase
MIGKWIEKVVSAGLKLINAFIKTILHHYNGIVESIKTGITNAVVEGLNTMMQSERCRARGYRNPLNFYQNGMLFMKYLKTSHTIYSSCE